MAHTIIGVKSPKVIIVTAWYVHIGDYQCKHFNYSLE